MSACSCCDWQHYIEGGQVCEAGRLAAIASVGNSEGPFFRACNCRKESSPVPLPDILEPVLPGTRRLKLQMVQASGRHGQRWIQQVEELTNGMRFPVGGGAVPFMDIIQFRQSGLRTRCFGGCRSIPRQSPTTLPGRTGPITKRDVLELEIAVAKTAPNMEFVPP